MENNNTPSSEGNGSKTHKDEPIEKDQLTPPSEGMEERFDKQFKCIQRDCDGAGNIPVQVGDSEWEAEQCQFHAEYLFPIKQFLSQEITHARAQEREELVKELEKEKKSMAPLSEKDNLVFEAQHTAYRISLDRAIAIIRAIKK